MMRKNESFQLLADSEADSPNQQPYHYRCPACGQGVDHTDPIAVAIHRQHVFNPHLFHGMRVVRGRKGG
jgi:hypothetical protein